MAASLLTSSSCEISLSSPFFSFFLLLSFGSGGTFIVFSLHLTLSTLARELVHMVSMSITCLEIILILFTYRLVSLVRRERVFFSLESSRFVDVFFFDGGERIFRMRDFFSANYMEIWREMGVGWRA